MNKSLVFGLSMIALAAAGNAASAEALATGKRARPLAEQAWRMVEQMRAA